MNRTRSFVVSLLLPAALATFGAQAQDSQKPAPGKEPDPKIVEGMMQCLAEGLPEGWKKAWFVISETGRRSSDAAGTTRQFEAEYFYATDPNDAKGKAFKPCGTNPIVDGIISLNDYLQPSQKRWTGVTMTFMIDGSYSANYDYTEHKPAPAADPAKAPAKKAARKKPETAK